jgi:hypothetical protein
MRNALETGQFKNKVRSDFMGGSAAASTVYRPFSSTACGMMVRMITPRWWRESRCAMPPTST